LAKARTESEQKLDDDGPFAYDTDSGEGFQTGGAKSNARSFSADDGAKRGTADVSAARVPVKVAMRLRLALYAQDGARSSRTDRPRGCRFVSPARALPCNR
jgi:hypothetical protein